MRPLYQNIAAPGSTAWLPTDYVQGFISIGFGCKVTGVVNYTVEHTYDDVFNAAVVPVAFPHSVVVAQTVNKDGNYSAPIRAVRLTLNSGTGSVAFTVLQGLAI